MKVVHMTPSVSICSVPELLSVEVSKTELKEGMHMIYMCANIPVKLRLIVSIAEVPFIENGGMHLKFLLPRGAITSVSQMFS